MSPTKVLLATDGSEDAFTAAQMANSIANKTGSELHVVYAVPIPLAIDAPSEALAMSEATAGTVNQTPALLLRRLPPGIPPEARDAL